MPNGSYVITISAIGYETVSEAVVLNNGGRRAGAFALTVSNLQLQTVEVVGRNAQVLIVTILFLPPKQPCLNKDLPQSIGTVTKELITDRQAFSAGRCS